MLTVWNWKKRSYWDNPPNKLFRPIEIKEMLLVPIIKIPENSQTGKNLTKLIRDSPQLIRDSPQQNNTSIISDDNSENLSLDLLGRAMILAGRILMVPEGSERLVPWTWADEILGVILFVGGMILVIVY